MFANQHIGRMLNAVMYSNSISTYRKDVEMYTQIFTTYVLFFIDSTVVLSAILHHLLWEDIFVFLTEEEVQGYSVHMVKISSYLSSSAYLPKVRALAF